MSPSHYGIFVHLTALPAWLALSRGERQDVVETQVQPALTRHPSCRARWFDAEGMTAQCSDVLLVETGDLRAWGHLWEELRDSAMFSLPYFRLESLVLGTEDGYVDYEATLAGGERRDCRS